MRAVGTIQRHRFRPPRVKAYIEMTPDNYIKELSSRLQEDGCEPQWETTTAPFLIGRRSDFKLQWVASRMHLFTIAAVVPEVTVPVLEQFTEFAMNTAVARKKGLMRGLQTGIGVFPALISDRVDPAALQHAAKGQKLRFACMGRPTVVDTANQTVGTYRGTPIAGIMYASYLRKKSVQYFPLPK
jgi:hypothetical protein